MKKIVKNNFENSSNTLISKKNLIILVLNAGEDEDSRDLICDHCFILSTHGTYEKIVKTKTNYESMVKLILVKNDFNPPK